MVRGLLVVLALGSAVLAAAYLAVGTGAPSDGQIEIVKLGLQFLVVTVGGGFILHVLGKRRDEDQHRLARDRDEEQRRAARDAAVRELLDRLWSSYRRLKKVKRRLRSQMSPPAERPNAPRPLPYRIPAPAFEAEMEELLAAQIDLEQLRDTVQARTDLLDGAQIERVVGALHYAARYFHDVYLDYEDRMVRLERGHYRIDDRCEGLCDFLGRRAWSGDAALGGERKQELDVAYRDLLEAGGQPLARRYDALEAVDRLRDGKRHRIVATQCIGLAAADLQEKLRRGERRPDGRSPPGG